jgi:hypothetical protein
MTDDQAPQSYEDFVASRVKWLGSFEADFLHAAVGVIGELHELEAAHSRENILEELGDIEFYMTHMQLVFAGLCSKTKLLHRPGKYSLHDDLALKHARASAAFLLDLAKKAWVYSAPLNEVFFNDAEVEFLQLSRAVNALHSNLSTTLSQIRQANVAKLRLRYPSGYTDALAQARLDKSL